MDNKSVNKDSIKKPLLRKKKKVPVVLPIATEYVNDSANEINTIHRQMLRAYCVVKINFKN